MSWMTNTLTLDGILGWFDWINNVSFMFLIVPFFMVEVVRYAVLRRLKWDIIGDSIANALTLFAFLAIEYGLAILFLYKLYFWAYSLSILGELPLNWIVIISAIVLADFAYYWDHRVMHRIGIGWATHTVHHSSPHFNMSVAYRFGPLDALFPVIFSLPLAFLGFHPYLIFAAEIFVQTYQTILHTEMIGKLPKPIEYIFNTPSHHRVHHGSNPAYLDKNYAGIFIIWDRLFGTFAEEHEKVVYGITEPIKSNNPLVVFFHGFSRLVAEMRSTHRWNHKILLLVKPPGWKPDS